MRVEVPLRWADLDAQGHVNNARYIDYMQDGRADFLYALGIEDLLREGFTVVSNQVEYRSPVFFSTDPLLADITVAQVGADSVTLGYRIFQGEVEAAVARTTLSGYDLQARVRRALPQRAREVFESLVEPVEPLSEIAWMPLDGHAKISQLRVRWSDLDAYGHVNNAMIFDYVQEGRITFTAAPLRGMGDQSDPEHMWFLVRQDASYLHPIIFRKDPYVVRTGIAKMGRTSLTISSQVDDPTTGTVCAQAAAVAVFADAAGRPTPLTDTIREDLAQWQIGG